MIEYKRLRNEVQRLIRRDKNSWLENECKAPNLYDRTGKAWQLFENKVQKMKKTPCNIITEQLRALFRKMDGIQ